MRVLFFATISLMVVQLFFAPTEAQAAATPEREFIMSCTYGVMAGTLVGAATLAFSSSPGNNLQNVARGASLGLYLGIALGYYTAYLLPMQAEKEQENIINGETDGGQASNHDAQLFPYVAYDRVARPGLGARWSF